MKALLLCAGKGKRLGKLTEDTPKCLLPVGGKLMLDIWIEKLEDVGVDNIFVNVHHKVDKIYKHISDRLDRVLGIGEVYKKGDFIPETAYLNIYHESKLKGNARTLYDLRDKFDEPFFIIYSDVWTTFDLQGMIDVHNMPYFKDSPMTMAIYQPDNIKSRGVVEINNGEVIGFEEKPDNPKSNWAFSGILYCDPVVLDTLTLDMKDIGRDWLPEIIKKHKVATVSVLDPMIDIGTPESYAKAKMGKVYCKNCIQYKYSDFVGEYRCHKDMVSILSQKKETFKICIDYKTSKEDLLHSENME